MYFEQKEETKSCTENPDSIFEGSPIGPFFEESIFDVLDLSSDNHFHNWYDVLIFHFLYFSNTSLKISMKVKLYNNKPEKLKENLINESKNMAINPLRS